MQKNVLPICDDNKQRFFYQIGAIDFCLSKIKRLFEKQGVSDILNDESSFDAYLSNDDFRETIAFEYITVARYVVKLLDEDESCKLLISFADLCVWKKIKFLSELDVREQGIKAFIEVWNCLFLSLFLLSKLLSFLSENYADFETNLENVRKQRQSDLQRLKSTSDDLKKELHRRAVEIAHNFLNKK